MKKRVLSIILSLALLAALLLPVNTSRAAVSVETGIYSAMVESGMWLIDLKDIGRKKVEIGIAWSSDSSASSNAVDCTIILYCLLALIS